MRFQRNFVAIMHNVCKENNTWLRTSLANGVHQMWQFWVIFIWTRAHWGEFGGSEISLIISFLSSFTLNCSLVFWAFWHFAACIPPEYSSFTCAYFPAFPDFISHPKSGLHLFSRFRKEKYARVKRWKRPRNICMTKENPPNLTPSFGRCFQNSNLSRLYLFPPFWKDYKVNPNRETKWQRERTESTRIWPQGIGFSQKNVVVVQEPERNVRMHTESVRLIDPVEGTEFAAFFCSLEFTETCSYGGFTSTRIDGPNSMPDPFSRFHCQFSSFVFLDSLF